MDFGRPMISTPGIVAKSNIRLVEENHLGDDPTDIKVCLAANEAAKDLLLGNDNPSMPPPRKQQPENNNGDDKDGISAKDDKSTEEDTTTTTTTLSLPTSTLDARNAIKDKLHLVNCNLYNEQHLPPARRLIEPDDLVVVFESFNELNFVYAKPNAIFSNRNGHFHHNDFIGKPYGCKIRSKNNHGMGFLYLLRPTPELWARSLPHRTQIVHELDASMIVHYLNLSPNMTVCESGTGSGSMSHAILRSIAPKGKLHTYEFNKMRVEKAREEFQGHGLGHLVKVYHRDVCGKKSLLEKSDKKKAAASVDEKTADKPEETDGNSDNEPIDDGKGGFQIGQSIAHAIFLDLPEPWLAVPHAAHTIKPNGRVCSYSPCMEQTQKTCAAMRKHGFHSLRTVEARLKEYFVDEVEMEMPPTTLPPIMTEAVASLEKERCANGGVLPGKQEDAKMEDAEKGTVPVVPKKAETVGTKRKGNKLLCARPFSQMRGHTAFLTFATASNTPRPDPNA